MTSKDLIDIAEEFAKWLKEMAEKYGVDESDMQDLIKQFVT